MTASILQGYKQTSNLLKHPCFHPQVKGANGQETTVPPSGPFPLMAKKVQETM